MDQLGSALADDVGAEQLTGLRNAILELVTAKKRLERQAEHRRADLARLDAGARRALELGNEMLAQRAIERKQAIGLGGRDVPVAIRDGTRAGPGHRRRAACRCGG